MKPAAFDYYCPDTVEETVNLLSEYGDDSLLLAGGLSLGAMLKMHLAVFCAVVQDMEKLLMRYWRSIRIG